MITAVTAYIPIPDHPRSEQEYDELGKKLLKCQHRILVAKGELEHCWLYQHLKKEYDLDTSKFSYSIADNPQKNSLAYHIIQAQKSEWLEIAYFIDPFPDVYVWIDYGIFHIPGVTTEIIDSFLARADGERAISIPGCWGKDERPYDDNWPHWRFCGGVMVVPRRYVWAFNRAMKQEYMRWLKETGNISWEVNTLTRMEKLDKDFPVWWYGPCDHNCSMFTKYLGGEHADTKRTSTDKLA